MNHLTAIHQLAELLNELANNGRLRPKSQETLKHLLDSHKQLVETFVDYLEDEVRLQIDERVEQILKEHQDTTNPPTVPKTTTKKTTVKKASTS